MKLNCEGTDCGNCQDFIYIGGNVWNCALGIPKIRKHIEYSRRELARDSYDSQIAVIMLRDCPEVKEAKLNDLAWAIYRDGNAHRNDVLGFIEHLERYLDST